MTKSEVFWLHLSCAMLYLSQEPKAIDVDDRGSKEKGDKDAQQEKQHNSIN
jgi:hypothetical protein